MKLSEIKSNPNNPRVIKDEKFKKLCQSIKDFPQMMELRPIIVDENNIVLGGNMRLKALKELGHKEIPDNWVMKASELTDEQKKEFIVKDNVGFGEWDWDILANEWETDKLSDWGLDVQDLINESKEGDVIDLGIKQSIQVLPKNEYIIITEPENSNEWEELKQIFKCETVRSGGCKIGSTSDNASIGIERVFNLKTFKERVGL